MVSLLETLFFWVLLASHLPSASCEFGREPAITPAAFLPARALECAATTATPCPDGVGCCPSGYPCTYISFRPVCDKPCGAFAALCTQGGCCSIGSTCQPGLTGLCTPTSGGGGGVVIPPIIVPTFVIPTFVIPTFVIPTLVVPSIPPFPKIPTAFSFFPPATITPSTAPPSTSASVSVAAVVDTSTTTSTTTTTRALTTTAPTVQKSAASAATTSLPVSQPAAAAAAPARSQPRLGLGLGFWGVVVVGVAALLGL